MRRVVQAAQQRSLGDQGAGAGGHGYLPHYSWESHRFQRISFHYPPCLGIQRELLWSAMLPVLATNEIFVVYKRNFRRQWKQQVKLLHSAGTTTAAFGFALALAFAFMLQLATQKGNVSWEPHKCTKSRQGLVCWNLTHGHRGTPLLPASPCPSALAPHCDSSRLWGSNVVTLTEVLP